MKIKFSGCKLLVNNFKLCRPNFYLNILIDSENSAK